MPLGRSKDATPLPSVGFVIWVPLAAVTLTVAPEIGRPKRSTALKVSWYRVAAPVGVGAGTAWVVVDVAVILVVVGDVVLEVTVVVRGEVVEVAVLVEEVVVVLVEVVVCEVVVVVVVFEVVVVVLVLALVARSASVKTRFVTPCNVKVVVPLWGTTVFLAKVPMLAPST